MNVAGIPYRTIWLDQEDAGVVKIIDQRYLPHRFIVESLSTPDQMARAITDMHVRGAGLIGAAAGFGMYLASLTADRSSLDSFMVDMARSAEMLIATRPTAVNLSWAVQRILDGISASGASVEDKIAICLDSAHAIADEDADFCRRIGRHGAEIITGISNSKAGATVNILTHCNAGWLAFVDYGTATSPIYTAFGQGIDVHVWVDETRPRNQGASLTAWELQQQGIPYTVIVDNAGGHLMQHGMVDLVITGSDRTTFTGDVANKIGTYLKALAARDNGIPFYVALPSSTFDWTVRDGVRDIPIEQRDGEEVRYIEGLAEDRLTSVLITPQNSPVANYAFDVTPARLVTGLITERGICPASEEGTLSLFPEHRGTVPQP
ncbi:S-methyl-5-thioribose-1-phosphate isomerase [Desulfoprunum benzoelyticum]|uniref:Methylthioribose-1-phosphate isomerase n=1 Tax=Desulfoprunum benzoelyticum TaxID=1506996 RepID=A0A840UMZ9_9BACT|nr:S-methyl-5-thioribose-1-phosphate isomerase [Desulfoprunum benzoelyticum]MBB5347152.1 methylthioribose-1-phosphate isomerase [Desulfoprunum benzoelyticum]MBM9531215.1 S-methyl-5-thioribose-1-phosphate isomerase [Desulfoprunum benzoelyticum]